MEASSKIASKIGPPSPSLTFANGYSKPLTETELLTNHFNVELGETEGYFFCQYSVSISFENGKPVTEKGLRRKVLDEAYQTGQLSCGTFAYDGEKSLFTIDYLPKDLLEFTVVMELDLSSKRNGRNGEGSLGEADWKRQSPYRPWKGYDVVITFVKQIPMQTISNWAKGEDSKDFKEGVRVLDVILRQHAAKRGCFLVRSQSFFPDEGKDLVNLTGGVYGCPGFRSSFRATQGGLSLNIDVSTTTIFRPGSVIKFLLASQDVEGLHQIDWSKAEEILKNLRIMTEYIKAEYKITGLSQRNCSEEIFSLKQRNGDCQPRLTSVYNYFVYIRNIPLGYSRDCRCINVGKPSRPIYIPIELCNLAPFQRCKTLTSTQRNNLVQLSRQKPNRRKQALTDVLTESNYNADAFISASNILIDDHFTRVTGHILPAPKLRVGDGEHIVPENGSWNFKDKRLAEPVRIDHWAVVKFSSDWSAHKLCCDLVKYAQEKGISLSQPCGIYEEGSEHSTRTPQERVDKMFEIIKGRPEFILCIFPKGNNSNIYGLWKKKCLSDEGIMTQCIAPAKRPNAKYWSNVLLKINAKMGGINSQLTMEDSNSCPLVSRKPTMIIGMDVWHSSSGRFDVPSIAAVVSSRQWPCISRYRAVVRAQKSRTEMIDSLCKKVSGEKDEGIFMELLMDFYTSSSQQLPEQIIIFRDGVSESQFDQVLNIELQQIIEACRIYDEKWSPKFLVIVAVKSHHTRFFPTGGNPSDNVQPGTVIDNGICHPKNNDFYMCAHAAGTGTTRPMHYHVLLDQLNSWADEIQELVHSLSYVYQKSTTAVSTVAPIYYARQAASKVSKFINLDDFPETSTSLDEPAVPQLPQLHDKLKNSMFFC